MRHVARWGGVFSLMTWDEFNKLSETDGDNRALLSSLGTWKRQLRGGDWVLGRFYQPTNGGAPEIEYRDILIEPDPISSTGEIVARRIGDLAGTDEERESRLAFAFRPSFLVERFKDTNRVFYLGRPYLITDVLFAETGRPIGFKPGAVSIPPEVEEVDPIQPQSTPVAWETTEIDIPEGRHDVFYDPDGLPMRFLVKARPKYSITDPQVSRDTIFMGTFEGPSVELIPGGEGVIIKP